MPTKRWRTKKHGCVAVSLHSNTKKFSEFSKMMDNILKHYKNCSLYKSNFLITDIPLSVQRACPWKVFKPGQQLVGKSCILPVRKPQGRVKINM